MPSARPPTCPRCRLAWSGLARAPACPRCGAPAGGARAAGGGQRPPPGTPGTWPAGARPGEDTTVAGSGPGADSRPPPSGTGRVGAALPPEVAAALADPDRVLGSLPDDVARARGLPAGSGRYALLGELGRGGMGVVYRAWDVSLRRAAAIKMILDVGRAGSTRSARFLREAAATARLRHPHIVAVHEVGEDRGRPFLVMDLVDGESLEDRLEREGGLPPRRSADLVAQLAEALEHAHAEGVVHRDVKPGNVMVDREGRAHLMDFGLARDRTDEDALTREGQLLGTPSYMAPEQAAGQRAAQGPLSDVYGLGAVLYRLLVGRPPFEADSVVELSRKVVVDEPDPPRRVDPGVHPDLETIALRCLEKDPARRYPSAGALAEDLRRFLAGEPILARPPTAWERARRLARRHRLAVALVAVALLAGGGAVVGVVVWGAARRHAAVEEAWGAGAAARERFEALVGRTPVPYGEAHAAALEAFRGLDRTLSREPDHAAARRAKHDVAMHMGELALAERDFGLATTMFAAAAGLGVDDEAAAAGLEAVEEARGAEERRIRRGVEELLDELEGPAPAPEQHGGLERVLDVAGALAALAGGRREGEALVFAACRRALLDGERPAPVRVAAGLVLAATAPPDPVALDPLLAALAADDPVSLVVSAHVLAASGDPRFGAPLRAAREPYAERLRAAEEGAPPLSSLERELLAELGRALLIHGDPRGARAVIEELLSPDSGEFGAALEDFEGTLGPGTARLYAEALQRGTKWQRLAILLGLGRSDEVDLALLADGLADLLLAAPAEDRMPFAYAHLLVPFPFDALYTSALFANAERGRPSSAAWQAVRLLVIAGQGQALLRASATEDPWSRGVVALALGEVGPGPSVAARLRALLGDGSPWVRACAASALARRLDPDGLAALEAGEAAGDPVTRSLLAGVRSAAGADDAPVREVYGTLAAAQPPGFSRRAIPPGCLGERAAPAARAAEPSATRAVAAYGGQIAFATRDLLPEPVALLGRTSRLVRASALRSRTAHAVLEEELAAAPPGGRRAQGALRLMAFLDHPRAAEHARATLAADPDPAGPAFFAEVEALRALVSLDVPAAAEWLGRLRERWRRDPGEARALAVETHIMTPTARIGAAGLRQQALASCLGALADAPSPAVVRELVRWTGSQWTRRPAFRVVEALGEEALAALESPDAPAGAADFFAGWWAFRHAGDPARAAAAFERAAAAGWGAPRARLMLAWLALAERPVAAGEARRHLLAAERLGSDLAPLARFWRGWVALRHLHRPLEAEACWRDLLREEDRPKVPPPAGPLPELEPLGPADAPAGPWTSAGDPGDPFPSSSASGLALPCLGHYLAVERGDPRGAELLRAGIEAGHDRYFDRLLALAAEVALREGRRDVGRALEGRSSEDPTWPAWEAAMPALADRPGEALAALTPLLDRDDRAGATARSIAVHLLRAEGEPAAAREVAAAALDREPDDPRLRAAASRLAAEAGDLAAALEHARAAARTDPWLAVTDHLDARAWVAALEERAGGDGAGR